MVKNKITIVVYNATTAGLGRCWGVQGKPRPLFKSGFEIRRVIMHYTSKQSDLNVTTWSKVKYCIRISDSSRVGDFPTAF